MLKKHIMFFYSHFLLLEFFLNLDKIKDKILKSVGALIFGLIVPYPLWIAPFTPLFKKVYPSPAGVVLVYVVSICYYLT